ncbi:MAG TPA: flagellar assembly protein FliH [Burkholderiaceae bacterium]
MSNVIPKEQLTAYQRWEMASFGDDRKSAQPEPEPEPQIELPTAETVAKILDDARAEGYADGQERGLTEGFAHGLEQGLASGSEQVQEEIVRLRAIANGYANAVTEADETVADDLLNLALDLAKAMLKTALDIKPELMMHVVREAIDYLPALQQPALLHLHPEDALLVREQMGEELASGGWRIVEDDLMERGGCKVDTPSNSIDAGTSKRWRRLANALGKDSGWLE